MNLGIEPIHIVCVLDESGSMSGSQAQVVESFNSIIATYREKFGNEGYVSLYKFGMGGVINMYMKRHLSEVQEMLITDFRPGGGTPLYDAVGKAVEDHRDHSRVFFVVDTDGFENTSKEYTQSVVKTLVEQQTTAGWDFTFVGADLSTEHTQTMGASLGMVGANATMAFAKSADGYASRSAALYSKLETYSSMSLEDHPLTPRQYPETDTPS